MNEIHCHQDHCNATWMEIGNVHDKVNPVNEPNSRRPVLWCNPQINLMKNDIYEHDLYGKYFVSYLSILVDDNTRRDIEINAINIQRLKGKPNLNPFEK